MMSEFLSNNDDQQIQCERLPLIYNNNGTCEVVPKVFVDRRC